MPDKKLALPGKVQHLTLETENILHTVSRQRNVEPNSFHAKTLCITVFAVTIYFISGAYMTVSAL